MGQRLVVTIKHDNKKLARLYYHWSAYTMSALYQTKAIVDCIYDHNEETFEELQLKLIRFCEKNGGGIDGNIDELNYIMKMYPNEKFKKDGYSRNNGLIALSENGMNELQGWSEGDVIIDIDADRIEFGVCGYYESLLEYNEARAEWDEDHVNGIPLKDVPDIGYDLCNIEVEDLADVIAAMETVDGYVVRNGYEVFEMIA